ncbi:MAG: hypothetical protein AAGJ83_11060, partial [Planctomycetota bacterium]
MPLLHRLPRRNCDTTSFATRDPKRFIGGRVTHFAIAILVAGCFASHTNANSLDWLFGRPTAVAAPYPIYAGSSPTATPIPTSSLPGYSSLRPLNVPITTSPANTGAIQLQRPAYGSATVVPLGSTTTVQRFDNPSVYSGSSVYTGPPVSSSVYSGATNPAESYRVPIGSSAFPPSTVSSISNAPVTSYRPAPTVPIEQTLRGSASVSPLAYSAYSAPVTPSIPAYAQTGYTTSLQPVPQTLPLNQPRWTFGSGLRRFFNSLLGRETNYVSSYYRAPITYYRPTTTIDPRLGTTVTVQQPCSSYVQQLQRVPYNSFQAAGPASGFANTTVPTYGAPPAGACQPEYLGGTLPP